MIFSSQKDSKKNGEIDAPKNPFDACIAENAWFSKIILKKLYHSSNSYVNEIKNHLCNKEKSKLNLFFVFCKKDEVRFCWDARFYNKETCFATLMASSDRMLNNKEIMFLL